MQPKHSRYLNSLKYALEAALQGGNEGVRNKRPLGSLQAGLLEVPSQRSQNVTTSLEVENTAIIEHELHQ